MSWGKRRLPAERERWHVLRIAGDRGNLWSQHIYEALNSPQAPGHFNSAEEIGVFVSDWLLERWRSIHQSDPLPTRLDGANLRLPRRRYQFRPSLHRTFAELTI